VCESGSRTVSARVSVLFSAYDEEKNIKERIETLAGSLARLGAPTGIYVGIDGSTDRTADIARQSAQSYGNVHVYEFKQRRGKIAVLKDLVQVSGPGKGRNNIQDRETTGPQDCKSTGQDILVFTDANTLFMSDTLERLLARFVDPEIGGVCGRLVFCGADAPRTPGPSTPLRAGDRRSNESTNNRITESSSESIYWRWEARMKERESALDSCLGANGAIYAIRRDLFWKEIPDNAVVDDFVVGMKVRERGFRMVYEPEAVAEEDLPEPADEWKRRVRIGAGDFQALQLCHRCLSPKYGRFAWMFWSHKVLRWVTPHMMLILVALAAVQQFATGLPRIIQSSNRIILGVTVVGVVCALAGKFLRGARTGTVSARAPLLLCDHFLTMQAALLAGSIRFCCGNLKGYWTRTPRRGTVR